MEANPRLITALEVLSRVLRRWWAVVVAVCLGLATSYVVYQQLPKSYAADTLILVTPPQIPEEYVRATATDDMSIRLYSLRQAVLSRTYLEQLAEEFYADELLENDRESVQNSIGQRINVDVIQPDKRKGVGYFELVYVDTDPDRAADVVNRLAQMFMAESATLREGQAADTVSTLKQILDEKETQLRAREQEIAGFKARNLGSLPDNRQSNLQLHAAKQAALESNAREISAIESKIQLLEAQRDQEALLSGTGEGESYTEKLARLRQELRELEARYLPAHPRVIEKKRQISDLEANPPSAERAPAQQSRTPLEAEIAAANSELVRLGGVATRIRNEIAQLESRIGITPRVEQQLAELMSGYDVLKEARDEYLLKYQEALGSLTVERGQRGEQFKIVSSAVPSTIPVSPNKSLLRVICVALGLLVFVGPIVARALLRPTINSQSGLETMSDVPVLARIGQIDTAETIRRRRNRRIMGLSAAAASVVTLIAVVMFSA